VASCDNQLTVYLNGERVAEGKSWESPAFAEVTAKIKRGRNVLAVVAKNEGGAAGLLVRLVFEPRTIPIDPVVTDASWRASEAPGQGWQSAGFDDANWAAAQVVGELGDAPWAKVNEKTLLAAIQRRE